MIQHINSSNNEQNQTKTKSNFSIMKKYLILTFVFTLGIGLAKAQDTVKVETTQPSSESEELARLSTKDLSTVIGEVLKKTMKMNRTAKAKAAGTIQISHQ